MDTKGSISWLAKRIVLVAFAFSLLNVSNVSLVAFIAGNGLTDAHGAVAAFSIGTFILGTIFSTVVYSFILGVASIFFAIGAVFLSKLRANDPNAGGMPTPTGPNDPFKVLGRWFRNGVIIIAGLLAAYQSLAVYIALSAVSQATGLIVTSVVLTAVTSFIMDACVVAFIGGIASIFVLIIGAFISSRKAAK